MRKMAWSKPEVTEQEIGLEVTSYAPAEIEAA
jgi:coenzyme PQQ precursor peptide PqqA